MEQDMLKNACRAKELVGSSDHSVVCAYCSNGHFFIFEFLNFSLFIFNGFYCCFSRKFLLYDKGKMPKMCHQGRVSFIFLEPK
jgi:hypothetical protein